MDLIQKIRETISRYSMLSHGDNVLIGLSGGPDSVCLAVLLVNLRNDFNLSLNAVYIDHGLRPEEVEKEIEFCKSFCAERDIVFYMKRVDVRNYANDRRLNVQESARELRYIIYDEVSDMTNASKIALGHNADDQAETVLMRLLRGSGRRGLSGIPPVRGRIIRPLIEIERSEIEIFLTKEVSQPYIVDSSNLKEDYERNWVRHALLGEMKKRNPAAVRDICRTADILKEEDDYLEIVVTKTLMRLISRKSENSIQLFLAPLETMERPLLRRVLRRSISETKGLRGIGLDHIEDMIRLIREGKAGDRINLPKGIRVIKEYSLIKISTACPAKIAMHELQPPDEVVMEEAEIIIAASFEEKDEEQSDGRTSVRLDAGAMQFPLRIRAREAGDFFYPLGFGKKKKLQDFFVDEKVPRDERDRIPIVLSGNDIVWVAGYRADERFRISGETKKILFLKMRKSSSP